MLKDTFRNTGIFGKLLQLFFTSLFLGIIGMGIVKIAYGGAEDINSLKAGQFILSAFVILMPPVILGYLWYDKPAEAYSLNVNPPVKIILLTVLLVIVISPFINLLSYINEQIVLPDFMKIIELKFVEMEEAAAELTNKMLNTNSLGGLMGNLFLMAAFPAFCEEIYFRGALLNIFSDQKNKNTAIWVVAIIFSLIHFQMYGFIPRMILGALLGYLLVWSGNLWVPVIAHFTNNALAVLISYSGKSDPNIQNIEDIGKAGTYWMGMISAVISGYILWKIYKTCKKNSAEIQKNNTTMKATN
ncbi:MAG: Abortive infection protein [Bacteroidetes bacterium]|nr:Abortive infection protein [Bacteroidota bacterium]